MNEPGNDYKLQGENPPARTPLGAPATAPGGRPRTPLGNLAAEQHKKHVSSARTTIIVVGILTILANGVFLFIIMNQSQTFEAEIAAARNNPAMTIDESVVTKNRALIWAGLAATGFFTAIGFVFLAISFFVKSHPVPATVAALILYIIANLISFMLAPESIGAGIVIKIIIVYYLFKGAKSGQAIEKLRAEAQYQT